MEIALIEPFFGGSHKRWAQEYAKFSQHNVHLFTLPGSHWKWRMHGGAVALAEQYLNKSIGADLILATDMLDLGVFLGLTRKLTSHVPVALYMHENQLNYPWSPTDGDIPQQRNHHYSFINYTSALSADRVFFNSAYHRDAFLAELPKFLKMFPDQQGLGNVAEIERKSEVLHLGMDLAAIDAVRPMQKEWIPRAVIGWNHRWEYDKGPDDFFKALYILADRGVDFKVVVLGEHYGKSPACFEEFRQAMPDRILHYGYAKDYAEYIRLLSLCDILPVTSQHDFFGASVVEAMYCDVVPLLPNRLAYPEHIPAKFHKTFFYDDFEHMVNRLQRLIFDVKVIRPQKLGHFVKHYDWQTLAPVYDERLAGLKNK